MKIFASYGLAFVLIFCSCCAVPMARINADRSTTGVVLIVEPDSAKVFLGDRYIGHAADFNGINGRLELTRGGHVLRFEAKGFQNERVEVTTTAGPPTLRVKLLLRPVAADE